MVNLGLIARSPPVWWAFNINRKQPRIVWKRVSLSNRLDQIGLRHLSQVVWDGKTPPTHCRWHHSLGVGSWTELGWREYNEPKWACVHPLFPTLDCGLDLTACPVSRSCLDVSLLMDWNQELGAQINSSSCKLLLGRMLYHSNRH